MGTKGQTGNDTHIQLKQPYFDMSSATVRNLINRTWFSNYPCSQYTIYDNGSEIKLHFETLCDSYGLKHEPTSIENPQANAILERVHLTIIATLHTADLDMAATVNKSERADFLTNVAWAVHSTYHRVFKNFIRRSHFWTDMPFEGPFFADRSKIGEYRQKQTEENKAHVDWD
jgi:hypothetical protein